MLASLLPNASIISKIIISLLLGGFINASLVFSGQRWAKNFSFTLTCLILPMVASIISSVIAGNIALSLGMVGALSIVRFRHPVKTSFELSIYFLLVTVGIAASTKPNAAIALSVIAMFAVYLYSLLISTIQGNKGIFLPNLEIKEHEEFFMLEVCAKLPIDELSRHQDLMFSYSSQLSSQYIYKIKGKSLTCFEEIKKKISCQSTDIEYEKITKI